mmetsp:Transcript_153027/g.490932  ORF Transcript_153027/g.490932 Transcript_153027/m.490932 type:complete len:304 (+) Transcript_153027:60-971(+)
MIDYDEVELKLPVVAKRRRLTLATQSRPLVVGVRPSAAAIAEFLEGEAVPPAMRELLGPSLFPISLSASSSSSSSATPPFKAVSLGPHGKFAVLTEDGSSWLVVVERAMRSGTARFEQLWRRHPKELGCGRIFGRDVSFRRYQQAFGADYAFTGQLAQAAPLTEGDAPEIFRVKEELRSWLKQSGVPLRGCKYEACLANWYDGGSHSIGAHSDNEQGLVKGAPIFALSWGATRSFRVVPRPPVDGRRKVELNLQDGDLVIMGGTCQRTHKHEVPKSAKSSGRRISLTFRCFFSQQSGQPERQP